MATIFTKIIRGEVPSHKIAESDRYYAFLDIRPLTRGHTLVVPKKEVDYLFDLEDDLLAGIMVFAGKVARAIEASVTCERVGVMVVGLEVPHAHIHLVPFNDEREINIARKPISLSDEEMEELAEKIRTNYRD
ncbi:MAG: HIT family protein [Saprospiraceae bacterium]|nr:HIT family protein [Saprospiraceae bacterium]